MPLRILQITGIFLSFLFLNTNYTYSQGKKDGLEQISYKIDSLSVNRQEVLAKDGLVVVFAQYNSEVKVNHPPQKEMVPADISKASVACKEALRQNINTILSTQSKNKEIKSFLSAGGKARLPSKDSYLNILKNPATLVAQIDSATKNMLLELRSTEISLDEKTAYCLYLTFVYSPIEAKVLNIVISAVQLDKMR